VQVLVELQEFVGRLAEGVGADIDGNISFLACRAPAWLSPRSFSFAKKAMISGALCLRRASSVRVK
jgi:hypothetical protein